MRILALFIAYYGTVAYGFLHPFIGLMFFIHITIVRPESLVWGNKAFGHLHLITALVVLIGYWAQRQKYPELQRPKFQNANTLIFSCFVGWLFVVSLLAEYSPEMSFEQAIEMSKVLVLCFLFSKLVTSPHQFRIYAWVISLSFGFLGAWGFEQGLHGNFRLDDLWNVDSNMLAAALGLMGPFVLALSMDPDLAFRRKGIFFGCFVAISFCLIYTESRGGLLCIGVGVGSLILSSKYRFRTIGIALLVIVMALPLLPENYTDRINTIFKSQEEQDSSASSRPVLWNIALRMWSMFPVAGVGLGNFSPVKEQYRERFQDLAQSEELYYQIFERNRAPHGMYTGIMAETGAVGIALFLALLFRNIFARAPQLTRGPLANPALYLQMKGAQSGLLGFAVAGMFVDIEYIEMCYLQMFYVGAIRCYAEGMADTSSEKHQPPVETPSPSVDRVYVSEYAWPR